MDTNEFGMLCLKAHWRAVTEEAPNEGKWEGLEPPSLLGVTASLEGPKLIYSSNDWKLEGHLTSLSLLCEQVWWKMGWSFPRNHYQPYSFNNVQNNTYKELAPILLNIVPTLSKRDAVILLGVLSASSSKEAAVRLKSFERPVRVELESDSDNAFNDRLFEGKKSLPRLKMLNKVSVWAADPRPLQKRMLGQFAAELLLHEVNGHPLEFEAVAPLVLVDDLEPCVQESAGALLEALGDFMVSRGAFEEALPYLNRSVAMGPRFSSGHCLRFRSLLALSRVEEAEADWKIFESAMHKIATITRKRKVVERAIEFQRVDALIDAVFACEWRSQGLPLIEQVRKQTTKPKKISELEENALLDMRKRFAREALERLQGLVPLKERAHAEFPTFLPMKYINHFDLVPLFATLEEKVLGGAF